MLKSSILAGILCIAMTTQGMAKSNENLSQKDVECMAMNLYQEARGEGVDGMLMVAEVVLNRMEDGRFPKTVCGVIYAKGAFQWTSKKHKKVAEPEKYKVALHVAEEVLSGQADLVGTDALFFKASGSKSKFHSGRTFLGRYGNHDFYE